MLLFELGARFLQTDNVKRVYLVSIPIPTLYVILTMLHDNNYN